MIENKGWLGVALMHILDIEHNDLLDLMDELELECKKQGYTITIVKQ